MIKKSLKKIVCLHLFKIKVTWIFNKNLFILNSTNIQKSNIENYRIKQLFGVEAERNVSAGDDHSIIKK